MGEFDTKASEAQASWVAGKLLDDGEFRQQIFQATTLIGTDILPPSMVGGIDGLTAEEFEARFPVRWKHLQSVIGTIEVPGDNDRGTLLVAAKRIGMLNKMDGYVQNYDEEPRDRVLRPRQMEAFRALRDQMETGRVSFRGHFKLPTRFGKTVLFSEIIKTLDVKTLVLVPTLMTGVQAEDELVERVDTEGLGRVFGGAKERSRQVTITTYQGLLSDLSKGKVNPYEYDLIILDEAHLALAENRQKAIERFMFGVKLGFTATAKFSEKKQLSNFLYPLIYGMSTREAVEEGILAPFTSFETRVDTGTSLEGLRKTSSGDYDERELSQRVNNARRNQAAVNIYRRDEFRGKSAFVFCAGVDHATAQASRFEDEGVPAAVISGRNSLKEQESILKQFRSGQLKVLCSADLLTTGINEPKVEVCINARPTMSIVMAEQRGGRPLTFDPDNPQKHAYIIDIVDKDSNGVLYADVVEERASGTVVSPWTLSPDKKDESDYELKKALEIKSMKVTLQTKEILTILEDLQKVGNSEGPKTRLLVSSFVNLLGKPANRIAEILPYYYSGSKAVRVEKITKDNIKALQSYSDEFDPEIELPLFNVFQEMVVDTIYQRLRSEAILQEIPVVYQRLRTLIQVPQTLELPEVASRLDEYSQLVERISHGDLTYKDKEEIIGAHERLTRGFLNIKREISVQVKDSKTQNIHHELNLARGFLVEYRDSEHKTVIRRRIRKTMQEDSMFTIDFLNAREDYHGTEMYARLSDLVDPENVKQTLDTTVAVAFMDQGLPENSLDFAQEVKNFFGTIVPNLGGRGNTLVRWAERLDLISTDLESGVIYSDEALTESHSKIKELFEDAERIAGHLAQSESSGITDQQAQALNTLKRSLVAHARNEALLRFAARKALAENPQQIQSFLEGDDEFGVMGYEIIDTLRKNPNFVTLKLRMMQDIPRATQERDAHVAEVPQEKKVKPVPAADGNFIGAVQTLMARRNLEQPMYNTFQEQGSKVPIFTCEVSFRTGNEVITLRGIGNSKQEAKQNAAQKLLGEFSE